MWPGQVMCYEEAPVLSHTPTTLADPTILGSPGSQPCGSHHIPRAHPGAPEGGTRTSVAASQLKRQD